MFESDFSLGPGFGKPLPDPQPWEKCQQKGKGKYIEPFPDLMCGIHKEIIYRVLEYNSSHYRYKITG